VSRGRHDDTATTMFRLLCRPEMRKVYPSFPMSHVVDMPDVLAEIDAFRAALAEHFITFDPGDVDEKLLLDRAIEAAKQGNVDQFLDVTPTPSAAPRARPPSRCASASARSSTSRATSTGRSTCATSSSSTRPT
jgi:hypothetical protein